MTHDELLAKIDSNLEKEIWLYNMGESLRAVVELHKEKLDDAGRPVCSECTINLQWKIYPCSTIQAIESALA